jgi:two-component system chemotaxis response regulator CheB
VIRVAVADDSSFIRRALGRLLSQEDGIELMGTAASGEELLDHLDDWRPDAIILDLSMPGMGGLATLDRIMATRPTPVLILSTHSKKDAPQTIEALHRGALDFIDKQEYSLVDFDALRGVLLERLRLITGMFGVEPDPEAAPRAKPPRRRPARPPRKPRKGSRTSSTAPRPAARPPSSASSATSALRSPSPWPSCSTCRRGSPAPSPIVSTPTSPSTSARRWTRSRSSPARSTSRPAGGT